VIAPMIAARVLGVTFAFLAAICLVAAGYYHGTIVAGFPLLMMLIAASAFSARAGRAGGHCDRAHKGKKAASTCGATSPGSAIARASTVNEPQPRKI